MQKNKRSPLAPGRTNREQVFRLIQGHPDGIDDDDISELSGIGPRQQIQQLCTQLADVDQIRRESVSKAGKRRKIHNFPIVPGGEAPAPGSAVWRRRLANLVAATGRAEEELLEEALKDLAIKSLAESVAKGRP